MKLLVFNLPKTEAFLNGLQEGVRSEVWGYFKTPSIGVLKATSKSQYNLYKKIPDYVEVNKQGIPIEN